MLVKGLVRHTGPEFQLLHASRRNHISYFQTGILQSIYYISSGLFVGLSYMYAGGDARCVSPTLSLIDPVHNTLVVCSFCVC